MSSNVIMYIKMESSNWKNAVNMMMKAWKVGR